MVETSPDGRYRYVKGGSRGTAGTAYDTENGLLVGWNELNLREMSPQERSSTTRSISLMRGLTHDHVLGVHSYWDASKAGPIERQSRSLPWQAGGGETSSGEGDRVVFLTTPCITLEAFVETKVEFLRWRVVKRWSRQILEALCFLHQQNPPVVHKNLSLSTIYIDPSKSHLFVGGVSDIVAPDSLPPREVASPPSSKQQPKGGSRRQKSWGDRAWGLVAGGGLGCGVDNATDGGEDNDDDESYTTDTEIEEEEAVEDGGKEGESEDDRAGGGKEGGGARDVRAFATTFIEMVLKRRLDPALAQDEQFLDMLPVISGWPASVVDLLQSCRAPAEERPSPQDLLQHPFFELGDELDDQPVYGDAELIAAAFAAATALRCSSSSVGSGHPAGASANGRQALPPSPLFASTAGAGAAMAASGLYAGGGSQTPTSCVWGGSSYTPSCSTESPSPSSPYAAPCFGGVPTTPSSPPPALMSSSSFSSTLSSASSRGVLPPGVTPAAFANATIAARMQQQQQQQQRQWGGRPGRSAGPFDPAPPSLGDAGGDGLGGHVSRNRSVSCSDRSLPLRQDGGGEGGGGGGGGSGGGGGVVSARTRSASEDAVWDMLPSDESQCRRPFSVSAVEGRHGY